MIDIIETIARMNKSQQEQFIHELTKRYPTLAEDLQSGFGFELLDRDFRKELNAPYGEETMADLMEEYHGA